MILVSCLALGFATGCHEPNYRNEVTTDSEGHVEVHHVPKDVSSSPPSDAPGSAPSAAIPSPGDPLDKRIEALEAQARQLNEEIAKLKLQKETGKASP